MMLDRAGISTDHVMINVRYAGFVARQPEPAAVFWLRDPLKRLDPAAFKYVLPQLEENGYQEPSRWNERLHAWLENCLFPQIPLFAYKDAAVTELADWWDHRILGKPVIDDHLGDIRNWREHENLVQYLKEPTVVNSYDPKPFEMSAANPQIYFLEKIAAHQQGKSTLFFLTGLNEGLLGDKVANPGYQANLRAIGTWFAEHKLTYRNMQPDIGEEDFADHTHYTPEGYAKLSAILWNSFQEIKEP